MIHKLLLLWAERLIANRPPDFRIKRDDDGVYLQRWWVIPRREKRWVNVYVHRFLGDDEDRALHDHVGWTLSVVLKGGYWEHLKDGIKKWRKPGALILRRPTTRHRVELAQEPIAQRKIPAVTLFITGPRIRVWGFFCPKGWIPYHQFVDPTDPGKKGPGCPP